MKFKYKSTCSGCKYYSACGVPDRKRICNGKESMSAVFIDGREMPIRDLFRSIFDQYVGGDYGHSGEYFVLMRDRKHSYYAMSLQDYYFCKEKGRLLSEKETAKFFGEFVRGMTPEEKEKWDIDEFTGIVDIWGNVKC